MTMGGHIVIFCDGERCAVTSNDYPALRGFAHNQRQDLEQAMLRQGWSLVGHIGDADAKQFCSGCASMGAGKSGP